MYAARMGRNVIVSEETLRDLLEAHASLSAWYYELWASLRVADGVARAPDDAARVAFVEHLAVEFPEIAAVARGIRVPRMYVPPPPPAPSAGPGTSDQPTVIEPAAARIREREGREPAAPEAKAVDPAEPAEPAPPPMVDPASVRYDGIK